MSGLCTNRTDLTHGRQQHALFHIITFYYTPCHISAKEGDRKYGTQLVPGLMSLWPNPALSHLGLCSSSTQTLEQVQRQTDSLSMEQQPWWWPAALSKSWVVINHANEGGRARAWMDGNPCEESPPPPLISSWSS